MDCSEDLDGLCREYNAKSRLGQREVAEKLGHRKMSLNAVIRKKCLDCCVGQQDEVKRCTSVDCDLWPYRHGKNPFSNRTGNAGAFGNAE